ncbi:hypothetical protein ACFPYI_05765 [Halomarina salina]|uniref:ParB/Sulfiredoxin domain-containing protein n=1 Tax=Halomarina salina TaxID=1872699 RepID=A0ABD5RK51_9EURY|nr:hypothetical protein [Halomarina salina]
MVVDRALRHLRQGGVEQLLSKTRDQLRFTGEYALFGLERALLTDRQWYEYTVWRNRRGVDAAADPRQLRSVDPARIQRTSPFETLFCFRKLGAVRDGDWDQDCERLDDRFDYIWEALATRYEEGRAWEDVELVQEVLAGEQRWRFATGEEVWDWVERLDDVYESIRSEGYYPARTLLDATFEEASEPTHDSLAERFTPVANESMLFEECDDVAIFDWLADIQVDIGRDGEVLQHNGRHRLWIAQHLGLDEIPVCVFVRHEQWQDLRDEVAAATSVDELSDRARRHLDHPDMVDVRGSLDPAPDARPTVQQAPMAHADD